MYMATFFTATATATTIAYSNGTIQYGYPKLKLLFNFHHHFRGHFWYVHRANNMFMGFGCSILNKWSHFRFIIVVCVCVFSLWYFRNWKVIFGGKWTVWDPVVNVKTWALKSFIKSSILMFPTICMINEKCN